MIGRTLKCGGSFTMALLRLPPIGRSGSNCKAGTQCSIIWGVLKASQCEGVYPPVPAIQSYFIEPIWEQFGPLCYRKGK
jgi:hypothetical protein